MLLSLVDILSNWLTRGNNLNVFTLIAKNNGAFFISLWLIPETWLIGPFNSFWPSLYQKIMSLGSEFWAPEQTSVSVLCSVSTINKRSNNALKRSLNLWNSENKGEMEVREITLFLSFFWSSFRLLLEKAKLWSEMQQKTQSNFGC